MVRLSSARNPALLASIAIASIGYVFWNRSAIAPEPPNIRVEMTPERIARGRYIYTLADCDGCHSVRDWARYSGPAIASLRGQGAEFPQDGSPRAVSANITTDRDTGIGAWPDSAKIRAIREGIGLDGRRLNPSMPYERFRHMSDGDVACLVAYLDTLPPVKHAVPKPARVLRSPLFNNISEHSLISVPAPNRGNVPEYGKYLVTLAGCQDCHTARGLSPVGQQPFAGGRRFILPGGAVVSPNITPDPHTGMGRWSESDWLERVYQNREYEERGAPKVGPENLTVMPWLELSQLQQEDLRAMFEYLRRQKPVYRPIEIHPLE